MPPGNRLEALKGDRSGQHSIRVDDQWRIYFESQALSERGKSRTRFGRIEIKRVPLWRWYQERLLLNSYG
ncbi:hypothetical protein SBV1_130080 [Verrucomicrobia bacterium]|nr:hypothetical protein SBV1_130080 [Verrucomicrobiota bacterium]